MKNGYKKPFKKKEQNSKEGRREQSVLHILHCLENTGDHTE